MVGFFRKPLIIAAVAAVTMGAAALPSQAHANDNALLGAVVGAGIGAGIGHNVHGRDGTAVGGAIGAITGAGIAASSRPYYDGAYYPAPATVYAPAPDYTRHRPTMERRRRTTTLPQSTIRSRGFTMRPPSITPARIGLIAAGRMTTDIRIGTVTTTVTNAESRNATAHRCGNG